MRVSSLPLLLGNRRKALIASVLLFGLVISTFSMSGWTTGRSAVDADPQRIRVLHFTLTPLGFNPSSMTVPEGLYVIEVTNRSDLSQFSLSLGRLSNHKLKEVDATRKLGEWRGLFRLKSDDFALTLNEKPGWSAKLRITKEAKN
jgi:hypothetical protein